MKNKGMFKVECVICKKTGYVYGKDKLGTLPAFYCSKVCEGEAKENKRWYK